MFCKHIFFRTDKRKVIISLKKRHSMLTNVVTEKNYQSIFGQNSDYVIGDMNEMTLKRCI